MASIYGIKHWLAYPPTANNNSFLLREVAGYLVEQDEAQQEPNKRKLEPPPFANNTVSTKVYIHIGKASIGFRNKFAPVINDFMREFQFLNNKPVELQDLTTWAIRNRIPFKIDFLEPAVYDYGD